MQAPIVTETGPSRAKGSIFARLSQKILSRRDSPQEAPQAPPGQSAPDPLATSTAAPISTEPSVETTIRAINAIGLPPPANKAVTINFDPMNNIIDTKVMEIYQNDLDIESDILTSPQATTMTMEGYFNNVSFHEAELVKDVIPDSEIVMYGCNFGEVVYEGYQLEQPSKKSTRGRKKKEKRKKIRKKQGTGNYFYSEITITIRKDFEVPMSIIPQDAPKYKFKIFRPGKIQLPGVKPREVGSVIKCVNRIAEELNYLLHFDEDDPAKLVSVVYMNAVMKNYKFMIRMMPGMVVSLPMLEYVLREDMRRQSAQGGVLNKYEPPVAGVTYSRTKTKLTVEFSTPTPRNAASTTCVKIFMSGKINILGAYGDAAKKIYIYLEELFMLNEDLIVDNNSSYSLKYNVQELSEEQISTIIRSQTPPAPEPILPADPRVAQSVCDVLVALETWVQVENWRIILRGLSDLGAMAV